MRNRVIANILYKLKREFGVFVKLQWRTSNSVDFETGKKTVNYAGFTVKQAILLPETYKRDFKYDLSYIGGNKNFTYGAYFDTGERGLILDIKDIPRDYTPKLDHWIVYHGRRFEVKDIKTVTDDSAYFLTIKEVSGSDKNEVFEVKLADTLILDSQAYSLGGEILVNTISLYQSDITGDTYIWEFAGIITWDESGITVGLTLVTPELEVIVPIGIDFASEDNSNILLKYPPGTARLGLTWQILSSVPQITPAIAYPQSGVITDV